jgi:hypothetical protein
MLQNPDPFWLQRWYSLRDSITITRNEAQDPFIKSLLNKLLCFGANQFYYFYLGFGGETKSTPSTAEDSQPYNTHANKCGPNEPQRLVKDYTYPPDYILRAVLDQITYDYEVLQRAMHQRLKGTRDQQETLQLANLWAKELLEKVRAEKLPDATPIVISYFNRTTRIRMIPYADVVLVGVPMTATLPNQRRDLLVLPHEIGHFLYWHGQIGQKSVRAALRDIVQGEFPYIRNWIEEIFADVFGFIVSGEPAIVPWALTMILDNPPGLQVQDNSIHPIDAVRPYVYLYAWQATWKRLKTRDRSVFALRFMPTEPEEGEDELAGLWKIVEEWIEEQRKMKGGHESFKTIDKLGEPITFKLKELLRTLERIIGRITNEIVGPACRDFNKWEGRLKDIGKAISPESLEKLIQETPIFEPSAPVQAALIVRGNLQITQVMEALRASLRVKDEIQAWYTAFEDHLSNLPKPAEPPATSAGNAVESAAARAESAASLAESSGDEPCTEAKGKKRPFMTIRDDVKFDKDLEPDIWKIVFAADGWTIKGPETWPTGDWERDWERISFHL